MCPFCLSYRARQEMPLVTWASLDDGLKMLPGTVCHLPFPSWPQCVKITYLLSISSARPASAIFSYAAMQGMSFPPSLLFSPFPYMTTSKPLQDPEN